MDTFWNTVLWSQFGAAIDMLDNAIGACPDALWSDRSQHLEYWYVVYHTLFWLDLYLSGGVEGFAPPAPFTLVELDPSGAMPERVYEKQELKTYLEHCRAKCKTTLDALTDEKARQLCRFPWGEISFAELMLYTMRHVQEHASQLLFMVGQTTGSAPRWVGRAKN